MSKINKKENFFNKDFKEMFYSQIVSIIGGLITGTILAYYTDKLLMIPGMLIIFPAFFEMRGNISGTFASRFASGLFLGVIDTKGNTKEDKNVIFGNIVASFTLAIMVSFLIGLIAYLFNYAVLGTASSRIVLIPLLAGIISNMVEIPIALFATMWLFQKGHDPNNIMGPFLTSTGDVTSIAALLIAIWVI